MSSELWEAASSRPDDDELLLVVADAFEERGDPQRAELLRVQLALSRADRWSAEAMDLRWRERVLLAREGPRWRAELPRWEGAYLDGFERGFPAWICARDPVALAAIAQEIPRGVTGLRLASLGEHGAVRALPELPWLRWLELKPECATGRLPEILDSPLVHPGLEALSLREQSLGAADAGRLAGCPSLESLRALDLAGNFLGADGVEAIVRSRWLVGLQALSLGVSHYSGVYREEPALGSEGVAALISWEGFPHLVRLEVAGERIDAEAMAALLEAGGALRELDLSFNPLQGVASAPPPGQARLQRLTAVDCALQSRDLGALLSWPQLSELRALQVQRNHPLGRDVAELLVEAPCWRAGPLAALSLEGSPLHRAISAFAQSPTGPVVLQLSKCGLDGADLGALSRAPWFRELRELRLLADPVLEHGPGSPMGTGAQALASASRLKKLELGPRDGALFYGLPSGLVELRLPSVPIELSQAEMPDLISLDLGGSSLSREQMERLATAPWGRRLIELHLEGHGLTASSLAPLLAAPQGRYALQWLGLNRSRLDEQELLQLLAARALPDLVGLSLSPPLPERARVRLCEALPWLRLLTPGQVGQTRGERANLQRFGW